GLPPIAERVKMSGPISEEPLEPPPSPGSILEGAGVVRMKIREQKKSQVQDRDQYGNPTHPASDPGRQRRRVGHGQEQKDLCKAVRDLLQGQDGEADRLARLLAVSQ